MAEIREIIKLGDPLLRQKAATVQRFNESLAKLLDDMAATMYAANGVGLAAPQIGISKCVAVVDDAEASGLLELINPQITERSGHETAIEYCLSVPEIGGEVVRAATIVVEAQNRFGEPFRLEADGWLARILQHEIDHLNGTVFIDIMEREVHD